MPVPRPTWALGSGGARGDGQPPLNALETWKAARMAPPPEVIRRSLLIHPARDADQEQRRVLRRKGRDQRGLLDRALGIWRFGSAERATRLQSVSDSPSRSRDTRAALAYHEATKH